MKSEQLTKQELMDKWDNYCCDLSSGERIEILLRTSFTKKEVDEKIQEFKRLVALDVKSQLGVDPFWMIIYEEQGGESGRRIREMDFFYSGNSSVYKSYRKALLGGDKVHSNGKAVQRDRGARFFTRDSTV